MKRYFKVGIDVAECATALDVMDYIRKNLSDPQYRTVWAQKDLKHIRPKYDSVSVVSIKQEGGKKKK